MVDPNALDDVEDEVLLHQALDRPPTGLRDIQYLYGTLYTIAKSGGGEYDGYLDPDAAADAIGEENSLIIVNLDLSGAAPRFDGVDVMTYTPDHIDKVAHSKYSPGKAMDHSVTHESSSNGNLPDQLAEYAVERLDRWPLDDIVLEVADEHPDGDIIHKLGSLADNEETLDTVYNETIRALAEAGVFDPDLDEDEEPDEEDLPLPSQDPSSIVQQFLDIEDESDKSDARETIMDDLIDEFDVDELHSLITVRVKTEPDGDYRWPGDFEVLLEAMKARKLGTFRQKNEAENSVGRSTDLITGEETRVVGVPEDPLKYYLTMQTEKFPNFDAEESWRNQPLGEDAALRVLKAEEFIESCLYKGFGGQNTHIYYLPYFSGEVTADKMRALYRILAELTESDDPEKPPLVQAYNACGDMRGELRFYTIVMLYQQSERRDILGEGTDQTTVYPVELANAHNRVLNGPYFGEGNPFPTTEHHPLLDPETSFFEAVATGQYGYFTFPEEAHDESSPASDPRVDLMYTSISGEPIDVSLLLEEYIEAIDEHDDQEYGFPTTLISSQFAQLCALAQAGLLSAGDDIEQPYLDIDATYPMTDPSNTPDPDAQPEQLELPSNVDPDADIEDLSPREYREEYLEAFLDSHPPLQNPERRAAFLLGALVGHLSVYQRRQGKHRTLANQHQITHLSKNNINGVVSNVMQKNTAYAAESGYGITFYGELTSRLMDTMTKSEPQEWSISVDDLRANYAFGIVYGQEQAYAERVGAEEEDESADDDASDDDASEEADEGSETAEEPPQAD